MAGPTVTLTFAGETKDLDKAFGTVSSGADRMARDVSDSSSRAASSAGSGLDTIGDKADGAEGKFQGLSDVVSGFSDTATAFAEGDVAGMAAGLASMAGGIAGFVVPMLGTLAAGIGASATATWGFTTALLANPITWIVVGIIALIAVIVLLIVYWDEVAAAAAMAVDWIVGKWNWLVEKVAAIAQAIWTWLTDKIGGAWTWVQGKAEQFWGWLRGLPGKVGSAFGSIARTISGPFRSAFNFIASAWNNTIGRLRWTVPGWIPFIGGNTISVPRLPKFHTGGVVGGTQGSEMLAVLQAGERVIPAGQGAGRGGTVSVSFRGDVDSAFATAFMKLVRTGKIQFRGA